MAMDNITTDDVLKNYEDQTLSLRENKYKLNEPPTFRKFFSVVKVLYIDQIKKESFAVPPLFEKHLENVPLKVGEDARFFCKIDGFPTPDVTWYKGGEEIKVVQESLEECRAFKYYAIHKNKSLTLIVSNATVEDLGNYSCKIFNNVGEAHSTAMLYQLLPLPKKLELKKQASSCGSKSGKRFVIEETITIVEKKYPARLNPARMSIRSSIRSPPSKSVVFPADKAIFSPPSSLPTSPMLKDTSSWSMMSEKEEKYDVNKGENLTLTYIPLTINSKTEDINTKYVEKKRTGEDDYISSSTECFDHPVEYLERGNTFSSGPTPITSPTSISDNVFHSELTKDSSLNEIDSDGISSDEEIKRRVEWIERGESSDSDFRRDSIPYHMHLSRFHSMNNDHLIDDNDISPPMSPLEEIVNENSITSPEDVSSASEQASDSNTEGEEEDEDEIDRDRKISRLTEMDSASAVLFNSGRKSSSGSVGTGAIVRFVRAKSQNDYFDTFFGNAEERVQKEDDNFQASITEATFEGVAEESHKIPKEEKKQERESVEPTKNIEEEEDFAAKSGIVLGNKLECFPEKNVEEKAIDDVKEHVGKIDKNIQVEDDATAQLNDLIEKLREFSTREYVFISSLKVGKGRSSRVQSQVLSGDEVEDMMKLYQQDGNKESVQNTPLRIHTEEDKNKEVTESELMKKPQFIVPLQDMSVSSREEAILKVSVTARPAPTITWHKDGKPLECKEDDASLTNDNLDEDKAEYTCVAKNAAGEAVTKATVTVTSSPNFVKDVTLRTDGDWLSKYKVIRILGSGRFGQVHLVSDKSNNVEYAAKQCVCRRLSQRKELEHEIEVMNKLKHEKLIQIFDAYLANKEIILIMELVSGGELFERIADETFNLTEKLAGDYIKQILDGVAYMHQNSILHLDLKPENILCLNPNQLDRIKIIDFGFARKYTPNTPLKVMFGTPEFVAPEIVNFDPLGPETDIWSIGVIAYVLLSGLSPFMGDDDAETLSNVTACDWDFDDECFDEISDAAKNFIERLLVNRKSDRPTCEGCLGLAWLSDSDVTDGPAKTLSGAVTNMKKFVARRKWQRSITAVRAMGRFQSMLKGINNNEEEKPLMAGSSEKPVEAK